MSIQAIQLLGFSGERKRASDGKLHADVSVKVNHQSNNPNLMRDLGQKFLSSGQKFKFGDHAYSVENFTTDSNDSIRLFINRDDDLTALLTRRSLEESMWSSLEKLFVVKGE